MWRCRRYSHLHTNECENYPLHTSLHSLSVSENVSVAVASQYNTELETEAICMRFVREKYRNYFAILASLQSSQFAQTKTPPLECYFCISLHSSFVSSHNKKWSTQVGRRSLRPTTHSVFDNKITRPLEPVQFTVRLPVLLQDGSRSTPTEPPPPPHVRCVQPSSHSSLCFAKPAVAVWTPRVRQSKVMVFSC